MRLSWGGKERWKCLGAPLSPALCWDWQELPWTQKLQEKGLIPREMQGLYSLCSPKKQSKSSVKLQQQCKGSGRTKCKLCLPASGPRICPCSHVMQLGSIMRGAHGFDTWTQFPLTSLLPNNLLLLVQMAPSKIPTSSLISGSCAPPGHLGNLALVFVLAHLAVMGFVAVVQKTKWLSTF